MFALERKVGHRQSLRSQTDNAHEGPDPFGSNGERTILRRKKGDTKLH